MSLHGHGVHPQMITTMHMYQETTLRVVASLVASAANRHNSCTCSLVLKCSDNMTYGKHHTSSVVICCIPSIQQYIMSLLTVGCVPNQLKPAQLYKRAKFPWGHRPTGLLINGCPSRAYLHLFSLGVLCQRPQTLPTSWPGGLTIYNPNRACPFIHLNMFEYVFIQ